MRELTQQEIDAISGGVFPVLALYAGAAFIAGVAAGISAATAAKSDN